MAQTDSFEWRTSQLTTDLSEARNMPHLKRKWLFPTMHSVLRSVQMMQLCSWDKGQCPHGALFHAVPGCCKCFQQCQIARTARVGTIVSYPTLLKALATPWESVEQCSMGTQSFVPWRKVASSGPTFSLLLFAYMGNLSDWISLHNWLDFLLELCVDTPKLH